MPDIVKPVILTRRGRGAGVGGPGRLVSAAVARVGRAGWRAGAPRPLHTLNKLDLNPVTTSQPNTSKLGTIGRKGLVTAWWLQINKSSANDWAKHYKAILATPSYFVENF